MYAPLPASPDKNPLGSSTGFVINLTVEPAVITETFLI